MKAHIDEPCFACGRPMRGKSYPAQVEREDTVVHVGPDCASHIKAAGNAGYQPPLGGPRLFHIDTQESTNGSDR